MFPMTPWTRRLLVANVIAFFVTVSSPGLFYQLQLNPQRILAQPWMVFTAVTYMFLHGDIAHIAINMFVIWMFGRTLEQIWGSSRFLRFYFACGIGGALLSFVFAYNTPVIGASAAAYGILLAFAILFPNQRLLLFPFFIPVKARTLVIALVVIELIMGFSSGDGIAHFAHLGGMAAALIMLRGEYQLRRFNMALRALLAKFPVKIIMEAG